MKKRSYYFLLLFSLQALKGLNTSAAEESTPVQELKIQKEDKQSAEQVKQLNQKEENVQEMQQEKQLEQKKENAQEEKGEEKETEEPEPLSPKELKARKHYTTLKDRYSFDPATNKWSNIDKFSTIRILPSEEQTPQIKSLYKEFWGYDSTQKRWYKANIPLYGYLYEEEEEEEKKKKSNNPFRFISVDFLGGSALTYHQIPTENLFFYENYFYKDKLFLVRKTADNKPYQQPIYQIKWFKNDFEKVSTKMFFLKDPVGEDITFSAIRISIPCNFGINVLLFKKLRLGVRLNYHINFLKELKTNQERLEKLKLETSRFYLIDTVGIIGYKFKSNIKQEWFIHLGFGIGGNLGDEWNPFKNQQGKLFQNRFLASYWILLTEGSYERILNRVFKLIGRLGISTHFSFREEIKKEQNEITTEALKVGSLNFRHYMVYLQLGINMNLAKRPLQKMKKKSRKKIQDKVRKK